MARLLPFVQFEFPFLLGPADGRYLARDEPPGDGEGEQEPGGGSGSGDERATVLILRSVGAPRRRLFSGRRPTAEDAEQPEAAPVPATRATVVRSRELGTLEQAATWLDGTIRDEDEREAAIAEAALILNRALHAHRAASLDPFVQEVSPEAATAIRIGYGDGDRLAGGSWLAASTLPSRPPRRRRADQLQPQERLAAVLGGRDEVHACETLIIRARLDLDQGREREAALQLRVGLEALLVELAGEKERHEQAEDMGALGAARGAVGNAANAALQGPLDPQAAAAVTDALHRCERILRRRRLLTH